MSDFTTTRFEIGDTAVTIAADAIHVPHAVDAILNARAEIERKISKDPFFLTTFEPYECARTDGEAVRRMCEASRAAGVGPMAAVAGAIAQAGLEAMAANGCGHGWVDNGGDIALVLEKPAIIEIYSEPGASEAAALEMEPEGEIVGVCSSSGRLGHSISLGESNVSVAIGDSAVLADAVATAIGNGIRREEDLETCHEPFRHLRGLRGGLVMFDDSVSMWGRVPRIVEVEHNPYRITAHSRMSAVVNAENASCESKDKVIH
ncbi:MAG: UPF0280 family protein [Methanobacteriota archaeon]|nr:MAG: UPF0280 family protein [Euryarchaeota archaeon]